MGFVESLQKRWKLKNVKQVWLALLVFALTGTSIALLKRPLLQFFFPDGDKPMWFLIGYWVFILPIYNVVLLAYGTLFGMFDFFWSFEKRMFNRLFFRGK